MKALYTGGKESPSSNSVIAVLSDDSHSNELPSGERKGRESLRRSIAFSTLPNVHVNNTTHQQGDETEGGSGYEGYESPGSPILMGIPPLSLSMEDTGPAVLPSKESLDFSGNQTDDANATYSVHSNEQTTSDGDHQNETGDHQNETGENTVITRRKDGVEENEEIDENNKTEKGNANSSDLFVGVEGGIGNQLMIIRNEEELLTGKKNEMMYKDDSDAISKSKGEWVDDDNVACSNLKQETAANKNSFFKSLDKQNESFENPNVGLTVPATGKKPSKFFQDPTTEYQSPSPPVLSGSSSLKVLSIQGADRGPSSIPPYIQPPLKNAPVAGGNNETTVTTNCVTPVTIATRQATKATTTTTSEDDSPFVADGGSIDSVRVRPAISRTHSSLPCLSEIDSRQPQLYQESFYQSSSHQRLVSVRSHSCDHGLYQKSFYSSQDYRLLKH